MKNLLLFILILALCASKYQPCDCKVVSRFYRKGKLVHKDVAAKIAKLYETDRTDPMAVLDFDTKTTVLYDSVSYTPQ